MVTHSEEGCEIDTYRMKDRTWFSVFPVRLPRADWAAPVAESTYDLRVEESLSDMMACTDVGCLALSRST